MEPCGFNPHPVAAFCRGGVDFLWGEGKTLEGEETPFGDGFNAAKPLSADFALHNRRSPSKPPSSPRTSLHGNRRVGLWRFPTFLERRLPYREVFGVSGGAMLCRERLRTRFVSKRHSIVSQQASFTRQGTTHGSFPTTSNLCRIPNFAGA